MASQSHHSLPNGDQAAEQRPVQDAAVKPRAMPMSMASRGVGLAGGRQQPHCAVAGAPRRRVPDTSAVAPQRSLTGVEKEVAQPVCTLPVFGSEAPRRVAFRLASIGQRPRRD